MNCMRKCTIVLYFEIAHCSYVLALEKKNGSGQKNICLKYIRLVQQLLLEVLSKNSLPKFLIIPAKLMYILCEIVIILIG